MITSVLNFVSRRLDIYTSPCLLITAYQYPLAEALVFIAVFPSVACQRLVLNIRSNLLRREPELVTEGESIAHVPVHRYPINSLGSSQPVERARLESDVAPRDIVELTALGCDGRAESYLDMS